MRQVMERITFVERCRVDENRAGGRRLEQDVSERRVVGVLFPNGRDHPSVDDDDM